MPEELTYSDFEVAGAGEPKAALAGDFDIAIVRMAGRFQRGEPR